MEVWLTFDEFRDAFQLVTSARLSVKYPDESTSTLGWRYSPFQSSAWSADEIRVHVIPWPSGLNARWTRDHHGLLQWMMLEVVQ